MLTSILAAASVLAPPEDYCTNYPFRQAVFAPGGATVLVLDDVTESLYVFDFATRRPTHVYPVGAEAAHVSVSADGRMAAVASQGEPSVAVVDLVENTLVTIPYGAFPSWTALTADGSQLLVGVLDEVIQTTLVDVWDLGGSPTWSHAIDSKHKLCAQNRLLLSDDGQRLTVSSWSGFRVMDVATGTQLTPYYSLEGADLGIDQTGDWVFASAGREALWLNNKTFQTVAFPNLPQSTIGDKYVLALQGSERLGLRKIEILHRVDVYDETHLQCQNDEIPFTVAKTSMGACVLGAYNGGPAMLLDFENCDLLWVSASVSFTRAYASEDAPVGMLTGSDRKLTFLEINGADVTITGTYDLPDDRRYCTPATPNSSGASAEITASDPVPPLVLSASQMPANQFGYFLIGMNPGHFQPPGADGPLCLGGAIGRFVSQVQNTGATGSFSILVDSMNLPFNPPVAAQPGDVFYFQAWFRDQPSSNFTDAVAVEFE